MDWEKFRKLWNGNFRCDINNEIGVEDWISLVTAPNVDATALTEAVSYWGERFAEDMTAGRRAVVPTLMMIQKTYSRCRCERRDTERNQRTRWSKFRCEFCEDSGVTITYQPRCENHRWVYQDIIDGVEPESKVELFSMPCPKCRARLYEGWRQLREALLRVGVSPRRMGELQSASV